MPRKEIIKYLRGVVELMHAIEEQINEHHDDQSAYSDCFGDDEEGGRHRRSSSYSYTLSGWVPDETVDASTSSNGVEVCWEATYSHEWYLEGYVEEATSDYPGSCDEECEGDKVRMKSATLYLDGEDVYTLDAAELARLSRHVNQRIS